MRHLPLTYGEYQTLQKSTEGYGGVPKTQKNDLIKILKAIRFATNGSLLLFIIPRNIPEKAGLLKSLIVEVPSEKLMVGVSDFPDKYCTSYPFISPLPTLPPAMLQRVNNRSSWENDKNKKSPTYRIFLGQPVYRGLLC